MIDGSTSMVPNRRLSRKAIAPGRDQHGDGEDDAHRLQRADDGQRDQAEQAVVQQADAEADGARLRRVEGVQQEIPPLQPEMPQP
jgi:hypothetical protein